MIEIDASAHTGAFNYNNYFKEYFKDAGAGNPDPFDSNHIGMQYDDAKTLELYGKDFYYYFQNHIVSGELESMNFEFQGHSQLKISGLDISNDVGEPGMLHWLIAGLMGGGAPGSSSDADFSDLVRYLGLDAQHYIGGSGKDTYTGTRYADRIEGNLGSDVLAGGLGKDKFVFDTKLGPDNIDTLSDYKVGEDGFELSYKIFKDLGKGGLSEDEFSLKKPVGDHAQIVFKKGALFYVDDEGNSQQFAIVNKKLDLSHDDFLVA